MIEQAGRLSVSPSPSLLARKMLCPAYVALPMQPADRLRFLGFHSMAVLRVIARHLRKGYQLKGVEWGGRGYRVDLLFADPSGKTRLDEVKSSRIIREVHRLQAALYARSDVDEVVVSNGERDEVLTLKFIQETGQLAETTLQFLNEDPEAAATRYTPHEDTCYTCGNKACPYLSSASIAISSSTIEKK